MGSVCSGYKKRDCGQPVLSQNLCKNCIGSKFEDDVADLLILMGYRVERGIQMVDKQVDLYWEYTQGITTIRGIVECKYHKVAKVNAKELSQLISSASPLLREKKIDKAYLITTNGFAARAESNAKENFIECYTYDQLLSSLIDFTPYLKRMVEDFEKDPIHHTYVDVYCKRFTDRMWNWEFIKKRLKPYVRRWLDLPFSKHLSIIGDFGAGKTSFCKVFASMMAQKHLTDPVRNPRIPLLIRLSNYSRLESGSLQAMITDFLVNECNLMTNYATFIKLLRTGKFVLLLDGFDEMAMRVDKKIRLKNFKVLSELAVEPNKVVLTGRPGYFPNFNQMQKILGHSSSPTDVYDRIKQDLAKDLEKNPTYDILLIMPFFPKQIDHFLKKQSERLRELGCNDWHTLRKTIHETYNLEDLAKRPVLLDIIVQTIPRVLNDRGKVEDINIYKLYETYTEFWLNRESEKGEMRQLLGKEDRMMFMQELAIKFFFTNTETIHYTALPENLKKSHLEVKSASDLDYFEHDIRTCTFLNRSDDGYYKFIHKSFQEYFVATRMITEIKNSKAIKFWLQILTDEIVEFIANGIEDKTLNKLIGWAGDSKNSSIFRENAWRIYVKRQKGKFNDLDLQNFDFKGLQLSNCVFEGCNLNNSDYETCQLSNVQFINCSLRNINVKFARFSNVKFIGCSLNRINFYYTHFENGMITFELSNLEEVNLSGKIFVNTSFTKSNFRLSYLRNSSFLNCNFQESLFIRVNLKKAYFSGCNLSQAQFIHSYLRNVAFGGKPAGKASMKSRFNSRGFKPTPNSLIMIKIKNCNLYGVALIGQVLEGAVMKRNLMAGARIVGTKFLAGEMEDVIFHGARIIGSNCIDGVYSNNTYKNAILERSNFYC